MGAEDSVNFLLSSLKPARSSLLHHLLHLLLLEAQELLSTAVGKAALQGARLLGVLAQMLRRQEIIQRAQQVGVKHGVL